MCRHQPAPTPLTLVHASDGGVLSCQVCPGSRCVWNKARDLHGERGSGVWGHGRGDIGTPRLVAVVQPHDPNLHILWVVELWFPVRDPAHATLSIAKFLTKGSILGLGMPAAVWVMESNIEEERPGEGGGSGAGDNLCAPLAPPVTAFCVPPAGCSGLPGTQGPIPPRVLALQEAPDQRFDAGDVPPHLQHRTVFFRVGKVEGVHSLRPNVLLPNDPYRNTDVCCAKRRGAGPLLLPQGWCRDSAPSQMMPQSLLLYTEALLCVVRKWGLPGTALPRPQRAPALEQRANGGEVWVRHEAGSQKAAAEQKWKQYGGRGGSRAGA